MKVKQALKILTTLRGDRDVVSAQLHADPTSSQIPLLQSMLKSTDYEIRRLEELINNQEMDDSHGLASLKSLKGVNID